MELKRNVEAVREARKDDEPEVFNDSDCKVEINNLLHMYMPGNTTLNDVDDLAMAILITIRSAWAK